MRRFKRWAILLLLVAAIVYLWWVGRESDEQGPERAPAVGYAPLDGPLATGDQLLLDLDDDVQPEQIAALEKRYGLKLRLNSRFSTPRRLYRARIVRDRLATVISRLRREPAVEIAELDAIYGIPPLEAATTAFEAPDAARRGFPNDPQFAYQWHMKQIGMPEAWTRAAGKGVIVAVIDTGVAYTDRGQRFKRVPDLANTTFVAGYDFVNHHEYGLDDHGHGTHVAGTIAQSTHNGIGVTGVAYQAKIMPLKVLSARGFGSVADIAESIRFAADNGAKVINMSLGGARSSKILGSAVEYAAKKGVLVVCAAGNEGRGRVSFPAAYPGAVAVAATQFDRTTTFYSNWGPEIALAAPGGNTRVDQNNDGRPDGVLQNTIQIGNPAENDYLLFMGTSMASPHAAGVAALVFGQGVTEPKAVLKVLKSTAKHPKGKSWDAHYGAGIIDAAAAVSKAGETWAGYRAGLAGLFGLFVLWGLRGRGRLGLNLGLASGLSAGLGGLLGSAGLFFLPALGLVPGGDLGTLLTQGVPSWDLALLGVAAHGNPLFFSALLPIGLTLLLYQVRPLRGVLFGLGVGVAAHLAFHLLFDTVDVTYLPNGFGLDGIWLGLNALAALWVARAVAARSA